MSRWVEVCPEETLTPGRMHHWEDNYWVVMVANVDGQIFAVQGNCTHANVPLAQGVLEGHTVMCCQHRTRFDLTTGEILEHHVRSDTAPALPDCAGQPMVEPKGRPLMVYPVKVEEGSVWVEMPDAIPPVGIIPERRRRGRR